MLASHPLIDRKRLASTGQSGGGTTTMFLTAVDDRLAVAAVSSGNTENFACEDFNSPGSVDDAEQNFIDSGPRGFDRWDLLYPMAPKPMLIAVSARDFFGTYSPSYLTNGRAEFDRLKSIYRVLGKEGSLEWYETPMPHALTRDLRLQIYNFFERTLRQSDKPVVEPPAKPEKDAQLYVGPTGNVVRDFGSKTPLSLARERLPVKKKTETVNTLLRVDTPQASPSVNVLGRARGEVNFIDAVEIQVSREVWLPGFIFLPPGKARSVIVPLEPRGRNAHWKEDDLYPQLAAAGHIVAAFDIRGIGDLSPEVGRGNSFYTRSHAKEESYAWASLMLGKPMLGQRVTDILHILQALRAYTPAQNTQITIAAHGHLTVPAIFAAASDQSVSRLYTARGLESYAVLLKNEDYVEPFANFVPDILAVTDIPELRDHLGTRLKQGTAWDFDTLSNL